MPLSPLDKQPLTLLGKLPLSVMLPLTLLGKQPLTPLGKQPLTLRGKLPLSFMLPLTLLGKQRVRPFGAAWPLPLSPLGQAVRLVELDLKRSSHCL